MTRHNQISQHFRLNGRVALITGASKGISTAMAQGLVESGARVVLNSRKQGAVTALAEEFCNGGYSANYYEWP